ncbi:MAG: DUF423 domain-containing protein [Rudaea sp.]
MNRPFAALAAIFACLAVACGAFGAHALQGHVDAAALQVWHTAVEYHAWHALAMFMVALHAVAFRFGRTVLWLLAVGIILFCGSLYALALGAPRSVGIITPFGGFAFIVAWALLAFGLLKGRRGE